MSDLDRHAYDVNLSPEGPGSSPKEYRRSNRRASVTFRKDEDRELEAIRVQDVEIEADSAAFRALEEVPDGKNKKDIKKNMFPSSNKAKKGYFSSLFGSKKDKDEDDDDSNDDEDGGVPTLVEGRKNVQDAGNYMLIIGMVYGIRTMTGRRDFFHTLLEHNSYFYDTDSEGSDFDSNDDTDSGNDDDSIEAEKRRRRKIKSRHKKFSEGIKSLFGFNRAKSSGGDRIVRKRYKNSNSGVSYAYTYKRSSSPKKPIEDDDESTNSNEEKVEITEEDFTYEIEVTFPPDGSPGPPFPTPEHKLPQAFKFKDYMPNAFRAVRHLSGISEVEYINSVADPKLNYIEFLANSKSGQFFFYSHDRKYMIKTMTKSESQYLRKIFPAYLAHLTNNPDSLIVRFYGMHRVKIRFLESRIYFVIMSSVFDTNLPIHHKYDLKGSSIGRHVPRKLCRESADVVKKDLNLVEDGKRMKLGREAVKRLADTLKSDARFLRKLNIMDYSLLVGVHEIEPRGESEYSDEEDIYDPEDDEAASLKPYFRRVNNGIKSVELDNGRREIYFFGIIDILTLYSFAKKAETVFKSLTGIDVRELSAVDPDWYAERFQKFILHHTDYESFFGKKIKERERLKKERLLRQSEDGYNSDGDRSSRVGGSRLRQAARGVMASNKFQERAGSPSSRSPKTSSSIGGGSGGRNSAKLNRSDSISDSRRPMSGSGGGGGGGGGGGINRMGSSRDLGGDDFGYYAGNSFTPMANSNPGMSSRSPDGASNNRRQTQLGQQYLNQENVSESRGVAPNQNFNPVRSQRDSLDFNPNIQQQQQQQQQPRSGSAPRGGTNGGKLSIANAVIQQQQQQQQQLPQTVQDLPPPPRSRPAPGNRGPLPNAASQPGGIPLRRRDDIL